MRRHFNCAVSVVFVEASIDALLRLLLGHFHASTHQELISVAVRRGRVAFIPELVQIGAALRFLEDLLVVGEKLLLLLFRV